MFRKRELETPQQVFDLPNEFVVSTTHYAGKYRTWRMSALSPGITAERGPDARWDAVVPVLYPAATCPDKTRR